MTGQTVRLARVMLVTGFLPELVYVCELALVWCRSLLSHAHVFPCVWTRVSPSLFVAGAFTHCLATEAMVGACMSALSVGIARAGTFNAITIS
jgi:hypothetical protein